MEYRRGRSPNRLAMNADECLLERTVKDKIGRAREAGVTWVTGFQLVELAFTDYNDRTFVVVMFSHRTRIGCVFGVEIPINIGVPRVMANVVVFDILENAIDGPEFMKLGGQLPECGDESVIWLPAEVP